MKNLNVIFGIFAVFVMVSLPISAVQIQPNSISQAKKINPQRIPHRFRSQKKTVKRKLKTQKRQKQKYRLRQWFQEGLRQLGIILFLFVIAAVVGIMMAYGNGITRLVGRFAFAFLIGILGMGLILAITDGDGVGKMTWLFLGILAVIFAIVYPEEFELFLDILKILAEL